MGLAIELIQNNVRNVIKVAKHALKVIMKYLFISVMKVNTKILIVLIALKIV